MGLKVEPYPILPLLRRIDLIVVQTLDGDVTRIYRVFLPRLVTEEQYTEVEWYGLKPQPGRWSHVHYELPAAVIGDRGEVRLRLQGVGNLRRDYPMRNAAPPIYSIRSGTRPEID